MTLRREFLFDCPEPINEVLNVGTPQSEALRLFNELLRLHRGYALRFVTPEEFANALESMHQRVTGAGFAAIRRFIEHLVGECDRSRTATPVGGPATSQNWNCALGHAMQDLKHWRSPQIIIATRTDQWPDSEEVLIRCDWLRDEQARVLARVQSYGTHSFALSDFDPWDLRHVRPPRIGRGGQYPCCLPKPEVLRNTELVELVNSLPDAWRNGWCVEGRFSFIPPKDWRPHEVFRDSWRRGYAFPHASLNGHNGHLDFNGRVWEWDDRERHWDVQFVDGSYRRISHDGISL